jgi:hypothetical protein
VCTVEYFRERITDNRIRLNPLDPSTSRHLGQCEYIGETNPSVLEVLLKLTDKGDYDWCECGSCGAGWQVPHHAGKP